MQLSQHTHTYKPTNSLPVLQANSHRQKEDSNESTGRNFGQTYTLIVLVGGRQGDSQQVEADSELLKEQS